jgi:CRISPR/Cas system-associated exonuclease Cas4 (RecB family)
MTDIKIKKYYPSSAAFLWGDLTLTKDSSGCLRKILFSSHGLREEIDPVYAEVGRAHEEWVNERLEEFEREVPVRGNILGNDSVEYAGRADYLNSNEVIECKATLSKRARLDIIRKGNVKINHLAQLVSYLIQLELQQGRLIVGFYEQDQDKKFVCTESREFKVTIDDEGRILIDAQISPYRVHDQLAHMQRAAKHLAEGTLGPRPADWDAKYTSPCNYCPFKAACDKYDSGDQRDPVALAKESLDEHLKKPKREIEIPQLKLKKEKS